MEEKYPIGKFEFDGEITDSVIKEWINEIEQLPKLLREAVSDLTNEQLDTPYRSGGWTVH